MKSNKEIWIQKGYEFYSVHGDSGLKIEQLAKSVGISKSSFYHHFADIEFFLEKLFDFHYQMCSELAEKEKKCQSIHPELINILLDHKTDILFQRQLRINRSKSKNEIALTMSTKILGNYAVMLWAKEINLKLSTLQLEGLFELATEDFYLRLNPDHLSFESLTEYFKNLSQITHRFT